MADNGNGAPVAPIRTTTVAGAGTVTGLALLQYLSHPVWPPPVDVLELLAVWLAPAVHVVGEGINRKLEQWAGAAAASPAPKP